MLSRIKVNVELLSEGIRLIHPIHDENGNELLSAAKPITRDLLDSLVSKNKNWVMLHTLDAAQVMGGDDSPEQAATEQDMPRRKSRTPARQTPSLASVKSRVESLNRTASFTVENSGPPLKGSIAPRGCVPFDSSHHQEICDHFKSATKLLDGMIDELLAGSFDDSHKLDGVASNHVRDLSADSDLALYSAGEMAVTPEVAERSLRLSLIAMAVAAELGLDENHVREIGLCGLVCDWGKFFLPERLQDETVPLAEEDRETFRSHPLFAAELLSSIDGISREVRLAATQVRENADGTGFPRGLKDQQIHPYARVLHVANIYLSLTSGLRGNGPYVPYDVMVYLLNQTKSGRLTQVSVRALLNVVSLFPIGSLVQLEDGSEAMVIRRNELNYTSPIVQKIDGNRQLRFDQPEGPLDLAKKGLAVKTAIPSETRQEQRIAKDSMGEILWSDT